ncbi:cobyrinate a,c-diamide synthase [Bacillota bacterium LX-D]|nr:cobyrinate a,c-diamide synthase [Bacillota bacterium LX-D]
MKIPRVVLAGTHSGVGKTTITTGIMGYLTKIGYKVQPYKVGPDYIDPSYHTYATGNVSRNLDIWMMGEETLQNNFAKTGSQADIAIVEGVMGLFDGHQDPNFRSSTAEVAKLLKAPVILIINVHSMAQSAAAIVLGYQLMDPEIKIAGVILNRIGSHRHLTMVKKSIEERTKVPVLGYIGRYQELSLPERHLGLVPMAERGNLKDNFIQIADKVVEHLDLEKILAIANSAPDLAISEQNIQNAKSTEQLKIAIAKDEAFTFYYQDSLDYLTSLGIQLISFSPLTDAALPEGISGIIIGGGFPEMFLEQLAQNNALKQDIRQKAEQGMPLYAECGGLMYLSQAIKDFEGREFPMVGIVPAKTQMQRRLAGMGYREYEAITNSILGLKEQKLRGHEFHYSSLVDVANDFPWAYSYQTVEGKIKYEGYAHENVLASYLHCHLVGNPIAAQNFLNNCRMYAKKSRDSKF